MKLGITIMDGGPDVDVNPTDPSTRPSSWPSGPMGAVGATGPQGMTMALPVYSGSQYPWDDNDPNLEIEDYDDSVPIPIIPDEPDIPPTRLDTLEKQVAYLMEKQSHMAERLEKLHQLGVLCPSLWTRIKRVLHYC